MDITIFCTPLVNHQTLTDIERRERDVFFSALKLEDRVVLWELLDTAFRNLSYEDDWNYRLDYFRWYTLLTWQRLRSMTPKMVSEVAFPRQLMMAILLDFDPVPELMNYIDSQPFDEKDAEVFYRELQKNVLTSSAVVGMRNNQPIILKDLAEQILQLNQHNDSLKRTEFFGRLKELLFLKNDAAMYSSADPDDNTSYLIDITQFLLGVQPEKIWPLVKVSLHEDEYEQILAYNESHAAPNTTDEAAEETVEITPPTPEILEALKPVSTRLSYPEIQALIQEDLQKTSLTDPVAIAESIAEKLNRLADYYHDDKIRELYYYNEADRKFYWNEELLKNPVIT